MKKHLSTAQREESKQTIPSKMNAPQIWESKYNKLIEMKHNELKLLIVLSALMHFSHVIISNEIPVPIFAFFPTFDWEKPQVFTISWSLIVANDSHFCSAQILIVCELWQKWKWNQELNQVEFACVLNTSTCLPKIHRIFTIVLCIFFVDWDFHCRIIPA